MNRIARRIALVVVLGGIAALCLSSSMMSMVVGALTAVVVLIDMLANAPREAPPTRASLELTPQQITVDLEGRR